MSKSERKYEEILQQFRTDERDAVAWLGQVQPEHVGFLFDLIEQMNKTDDEQTNVAMQVIARFAHLGLTLAILRHHEQNRPENN